MCNLNLVNGSNGIESSASAHYARAAESIQQGMLKLSLLVLLAFCWFNSSNASAGPVVVGSVNPDTRVVTIFQDLLVKRFLDGTPILNIYGGYDENSKSFIMVRAGKSDAGTCQTDAFKLARISGNRLALTASPYTVQPWNGVGTILEIKKCFSGTCQGSCQVLGDASTPLDLTDYICFCSSGQQCEMGLVLPHKYRDIVLAEPPLL